MITLAQRLIMAAASFRQLSGTILTMSLSSVDAAYDCTHDSAGNIILCGQRFSGLLGFLMMLSPLKAVVFCRTHTNTGSAHMPRVAVDSSDAIYTCTNINNPTYRSPHLLKYSSAGALLWQRGLTLAATNCYDAGVATDGTDVWIAGWIATAATGIFIAKYNAAGALQWQRKITHANNLDCSDIAVDASGNSYVVGRYHSGGATYVGFVAKYDASGAIVWQKSFANGGTTTTTPARIRVASSGAIYIATTVTVSAVVYPAVMKLDSGGTLQWARRHSTTLSVASSGLDLNASDQPLVVTPKGSTGAYLVQYDADGAVLWQREYTHANMTATLAGLAFSGDNVVLAGRADPGSNADVLVTEMAADGGNTGTYGAFVYGEAAQTYSSLTPTMTAGVGTDAAGTLTDGAGIATETANAVVLTSYPRD